MKETVVIVGEVIGTIITVVGLFICLAFRADNSDADALAGAIRLFVGAPCLVVGILILALCTWGLR